MTFIYLPFRFLSSCMHMNTSSRYWLLCTVYLITVVCNSKLSNTLCHPIANISLDIVISNHTNGRTVVYDRLGAAVPCRKDSGRHHRASSKRQDTHLTRSRTLSPMDGSQNPGRFLGRLQAEEAWRSAETPTRLLHLRCVHISSDWM